MKLHIEHCAGVSGSRMSHELDTAVHAQGASIERMLGDIGFFSAADHAPVGIDMGEWDITAEDGPRRHTVHIAEDGSSVAAPWTPLFDTLRQII